MIFSLFHQVKVLWYPNGTPKITGDLLISDLRPPDVGCSVVFLAIYPEEISIVHGLAYGLLIRLGAKPAMSVMKEFLQ
jgi:hypothetical protein